MRHFGKIITGAFLMLGATAMAQDNPWENPDQTPMGAQGQSTAKATDELATSPAAKDIRFYMGKLTNEAIGSSRPITRLVDRLVSSDRLRIEGQVQKDYPELNKTLAEFRQAWKDKYKQQFDLSRATIEVAFADSRCLQGNISDDAILASERLGPALTLEQPLPQPGQMGDKVSQSADKSTETTPAASDQKAATVLLPAMPQQHLTSVTLRFTDEGRFLSDWRLNVPDTLTAQKLQANLNARLTALLADKARWPTESRDAYHIVSHQVMAALADQPFAPIKTPEANPRQGSLDVED